MSNWIIPTDLDPYADLIEPAEDPWGDEKLAGVVKRVRATIPPPVPATDAVGPVMPVRQGRRLDLVGPALMIVAGVVGFFALVAFGVSLAITFGWLS